MNKEYEQIDWNSRVERELAAIVRLAVVEDLGDQQDWTTASLVPEAVMAEAFVATRADGVLAGLPVGAAVLKEMGFSARFERLKEDGGRVRAGERVARIEGKARELLMAERLILNLVGRLSGIATLTARYVEQVAETGAKIYDTRKTTPGYRLLEKYAVRCGGGTNHRSGLHRAVLIKDNHIALGRDESDDGGGFGIAESVERARQFVAENAPNGAGMIVEIEVDSLEQLAVVLPSRPDIVLLDNMKLSDLREAVRIRDNSGVDVALEASGGVSLRTVGEIARTGVSRISVGALTHSAPSLDIGLDWQ